MITGSSVVLAIVQNLWPQTMVMPASVVPSLFAASLAASVRADWRHARAAPVRRASRIVYTWLYALFGANEIAAWWNGCAIEAAAGRLGRFVVAGFVVLALIRVSRLAPAMLRV